MKQGTIEPSSPSAYDRRLKLGVLGIASENDKFKLENGYYVNEAETVIIQSTNETGKFFAKVPTQDR